MRASDAAHYLAAIPDPPCVGCGMAQLCRRDRIACDPFAAYAHEGRFDRDAPRRPTSAIYARIYPAPIPARRRRRR